MTITYNNLKHLNITQLKDLITKSEAYYQAHPNETCNQQITDIVHAESRLKILENN